MKIAKCLTVLIVVLFFELILATVVRAEGTKVYLPLAYRGGQTAVPSPTPTRIVRGRIASGANKSVQFFAGEEVWGVSITLNSGATCDGGGCYLRSAPESGEVFTGVVNPWPNEVPSGTQVWVPIPPTATPTATATATTIATATVEATVAPTATATATVAPTATTTPERRESGPGQTIIFSKGESVVGFTIELLPSHQKCDGGGCYLPVAPEGGIVTSGVVNPWSTEVEGLAPWVPSN